MSDFSLEGQRDYTAEHNDIVPVLLGLTKFLDAIAARVKIEASFAPSGPSRVSTMPSDEELIFAVLGLLSMRGTLRRWLGQCESQPLPSDFAQSEANDLETDLLR